MEHPWFKHDVGTLTDKKMQKLLRMHGVEGFGVYWFLVESLYKEDGSIRLEDVSDLSFTIHADEEKVKNIILKTGLFKHDKDFFWSDRVNEQIEDLKEKSEKARKAINSRWEKNNTKTENTNVIRTYNERNTNEDNPNYVRNTEKRREEKIREEERREERASAQSVSSVSFSSQKTNDLGIDQETLSELIQDFGRKAVNDYTEKMITFALNSGKVYKDPAATMRSWLTKDGYKQTKPLPPVPTTCDRCGSKLVNNRCDRCGRMLYVHSGTWEFEDIADPSEMASAMAKIIQIGRQA